LNISTCPYPDCTGAPADGAAFCPACDRDVLRCRCGAPNRLLARYCRTCGAALCSPWDWRMARGDAAGSGLINISLPFAPAIAEAGRFALEGELSAQFVYRHGHLFFPIANRGVAVYRARDARLVTLVPSRSSRIGAVAVSDEHLLAAGAGGLEATLLAEILKKGALTSRTLLAEPVASERGQTLLVLDSPPIACAAGEAAVHAVPLKENAPQWAIPRQGKGEAVLVHAAEQIVVIEQTGEIWGADPVTGARLWADHLGCAVRTRAGAAAAGDHLYVIDADGYLVMIHAGKRLHLKTTHNFGEATGLACSEHHVYVTGTRGLQRCVPATPASVLISGDVFSTAPLLTRGTVFAATEHGSLIFADALSQGERHYLLQGVKDLPRTAPVLTEGRLFLASRQGEIVIYAVAPNGGLV